MKRYGMLSALLGAAAFLCAGMTVSHAAITVLGEGASHDCFEAAEFSGPPKQGIDTCTAALDAGSLDVTDRAATLVNRGILKARLGEYLDALDDYNAGIKLDANLAEAYVDRGAALIMTKRYNEAVADLSKGIALGTHDPQIAYYDLGLVRERTGDIAGACDDYRQAVAIRPDFVLASSQLDICHPAPHGKPKN